MIVYRNSSNRSVSIDVPVAPSGGSVDIDVLKNDIVVYSPQSVTYANDAYSFDFPLSLSQVDDVFDIRCQFPYIENGVQQLYENYEQVEVVTPILPLKDIDKIIESTGGPTSDDVADIEKAVRNVIQIFTGQSFNKAIGIKPVIGQGQRYLRLPARLMSLTSLNTNTYASNNFLIQGNGLYLQSRHFYAPTIRADFDGWHENPWQAPIPIIAPKRTHNYFEFCHNIEYDVEGVWGWDYVPSAVQEAAKLLVNDYACSEISYRDRYIQDMTSSDWQFEFNTRAYSDTGNVRANQLLSDYVLPIGWNVV